MSCCCDERQKDDDGISISFVVAMTRNRIIGKNNTLPWKLLDDLKWFRNTTMNSVVIMGRNTYESIGKKPLQGRHNIILSSRYWFKEGDPYNDKTSVSTESRKDHAIDSARKIICAREKAGKPINREIMVIGGEEVFRQFLGQADRIYMTEIDAVIAGDRSFPILDGSWTREMTTKLHPADDRNSHPYRFIIYKRR